MAERELSILVRAKGALQASRDIGKVDSAIGRIAGHARRGVRNAITNIAKLSLVAAAAVASQVALGARSLARIEAIGAQTDAVIKSTGSAANVTRTQVDELAGALEHLTGTEAETITEGANLLLTFTNIKNVVGEGNNVFDQATTAITDMSRALGQDMSSSAIQLGKALNDPIKGITALRRVGVAFSADQEKQIKGWAAWGSAVDVATQLGLKLNKEQAKLIKESDGLVDPIIALKKAGVELTKQQIKQIRATAQQNGLVKAQKAIIGELNREFGGSAAAWGETTQGKIAKLGHTWGTVQETLAAGVLPAVTKLADWLNNKLLEPGTQAAIARFADELADAADSFVGWIESIDFQPVVGMITTVKDAAKTVIGLFTSLPPWVQQAVVTGWGLNKLTGGAVSGIVGELGKGLVRGVLGMTAGVVNAKAGVVNVAGGVGGKGGLTPAAAGAGGGAAAVAAAAAPIAAFIATSLLADEANRQAEDLGMRGRVMPVVNFLDPTTLINNLNTGFEALHRALDEINNPKKPIPVKPQGMSPDERQEFRNQQQKMGLLDRTGQQQKSELQRVNNAMATLRNTTATGTDRIVAAIRQNRTTVIVNTLPHKKAAVQYQNGNDNKRGPTEFD